MAGIKYDIVENLGVLSTNAKGWTKELNLVSWNEEIQNTTFVIGMKITQE